MCLINMCLWWWRRSQTGKASEKPRMGKNNNINFEKSCTNCNRGNKSNWNGRKKEKSERSLCWSFALLLFVVKLV